jgi:hypothetical protein
MTDTTRLKALRVALVLIGVTFIVGLPVFMIVWPSGWAWHTGHSDYPLMIIGVYATLGVFLIAAVRDPLAHRSLIQFAIWANVVHALIMLVQAFTSPGSHGHLVGDIPALLIVSGALAVFTPRAAKTRLSPRTA